MLISKKKFHERVYNAYWSVRAQRHLHQTVQLAARDKEYACQQFDVLLHYVIDTALSGRDPGPKWISNAPPPAEDE